MKKSSVMTRLVLNIVLVISSCGYFYETSASKGVKIGTQDWMNINLNADKFLNGDSIPQATTTEEWEKAGRERRPVWCYYNNDPSNAVKYGKLYNWYAVADTRNICPAGWHVPSDVEWTLLIDYLGGENAAFTKIMYVTGESNDDSIKISGFSGMPGGFRNGDGSFCGIGSYGGWWSSTVDVTGQAVGRDLDCANGIVDKITEYKGMGFSVRCIKD